jgi:hypothetical protein
MLSLASQLFPCISFALCCLLLLLFDFLGWANWGCREKVTCSCRIAVSDLRNRIYATSYVLSSPKKLIQKAFATEDDDPRESQRADVWLVAVALPICTLGEPARKQFSTSHSVANGSCGRLLVQLIESMRDRIV